jgi:valyl-tRNA synthetase
VTQTALADDEVEYIERQTNLWYIRYPFADGSGHVTVATTRPESMLGDTAVAVSPKDTRYQHHIGKMIRLPLSNREIPLIADHFVDAEFGSGAVKITPAHDPNDYQMALRHQLPMINIMTPDGRINEAGAQYAGLTMEEARKKIAADLQAQSLLEKTTPYTQRVGISYRSKAVIEPYLSKQWFVKMESFAKKLDAVVKQGKVKLIPKNWEHTYFHWVDNLRDWCISRQLWWGHQIPIWYRKGNHEQMICYDGPGVPPEVAAEPEAWEQDPDALDTWFSSGLWPFSTLGWPHQTEDLKKFYPNAVLVSGSDILFFWIARMILMGDYAMDEVPFPETFLHGLIYGRSYWRTNPDGGITYVMGQERTNYDLGQPLPKDVQSKWEKLSKSKGNVIDPLEIIDEYGTDAMRLALCASGPQNSQIDLDRRRFEEFKNFANKVWNGARFILLNSTGLTAASFNQGIDEQLLLLEDRWILATLNRTIKEVNQHLSEYAFEKAALAAYDFYWKEFCAYYLELCKPVLFGKAGTAEQRENKQKLLLIILCSACRLLHPIAPFITEELFHVLRKRLEGIASLPQQDLYTAEAIRALQSQSCAVAPYPQVIRETDINQEICEVFDLLQSAVYTIRNIRGEMKLPPGTATDVYIVGADQDPTLQKMKQHQHMIPALVKVLSLHFCEAEPSVTFSCTGAVAGVKILIPLPKELESKERERLLKEKTRLSGEVEKTRQRLDNSEFVSRAPAELIQKTRDGLAQLEKELESISHKLK